MSKKKVGIIALIIIIISAVVMVFAYGIKNKQVVVSEDDKMKIVVTSFPQYDFARAVAGDKANIQMLIKPGVETHSYEPTPDDIQKIQNADLFIYTGGENDEWVEGILDSIDTSSLKTLKLEDCVDLIEEDETVGLEGVETHSHSHNHDHDDEHDHDHDNEEGHDHDHDEDEDHNEEEEHDHDEEDEYDEHIWTSLENAQLLVSAIEEIFCEADPEHEKQFRDNAAAYREQIADVQSEIEEIVDNARVKKILFADRFPFLYFTQEFGLDYDAAFAGCAGDTEPSARVIASLIEEIQSENIKAIYHVEMGNTKTAQMIQEATGVEILELHSCHTVTSKQLQEGVTYVELMRQNAENLKKGLQ